MNNISISGRLGHDVSLRYMTDETAVGRFSVAVKRDKKDSGGNDTDWIDCVAFGKRAETINRFFHKGDWIEVCGRVKVAKYTDKEGNNRKSFDVLVERFSFSGGKAAEEKKTDDPEPQFKQADEDIPF